MKDTLDAAIFLVLASAAVTTLAVPINQPTAGSAEDVAAVVATTTTQVNYSLRPTDGWTPGRAHTHTVHGTLAQLLAAAAARDVHVDGTEVVGADDAFERAVIAATANATGGGGPVAVDAVWQPYPDAPVRGHVHVGPEPPASADVWAVTLPAGSGWTTDRQAVRQAMRRDGFAGVSRVLARRVVQLLFPPRRMAVTLREDGDVASLSRRRYRRFAGLVGADVTAQLRQADAAAVNRRLALALGDRFERDLRDTYDSPADASQVVSAAPVRVTVRRWSA